MGANRHAKSHWTKYFPSIAMNIYLVQRCKVKTEKPSEITTLSAFLSFDYMGSSEFEFGALAKARERAVQKVQSLAIIESGLKRADGKRLFVVCQREQYEEVRVFLHWEAKGPGLGQSLKERTEIQGAITQAKYADNNCWWDIENDWFAIFGKHQAELLIYALKTYLK
jgi:hypothetical protein